MSLDPRDSARRGRSKSPGRERSRSRGLVNNDDYEPPARERSKVRAPSPPSSRYEREDPRDRGYDYEERETTTVRSSKGGRDREPAVITAEPRDRGDPRSSYGSLSKYRDDGDDSDDSDSPPAKGRGYAMPGGFQEEVKEVRYESGRGGREKDYYSEKRREEYKPPSPEKGKYGRPVSPPERSRYEEVDKYKYSDPRDKERELRRYEEEKERDKRRYEEERLRDSRRYEVDDSDEEEKHGRKKGASFSIAASAGRSSISGGINVGHDKPQYVQPPSPGGYKPQPPYAQPNSPGDYVPFPEIPGGRAYAEPPKWEYAQPQEQISYSKRQETYAPRPASPPQQYKPSGSSRRESRHGSTSYRDESARSSQSKIVTVEPGSRRHRDPSPGPGLAPRMHSLSVSTGHHGGASLSLANAPGSPLLEAYHGTYQSISPMPSPLMIASTPHSDVNMIEALSPDSSDDDRRGGKKSRRTARFHDPVDEAKILAQALKGEKRAPDTAPLIEILPGLTHDQVLDLRVEYKRIVKTGSEKKGVNIAKHIKLRLKEEDPSLMKACYACALGKWESEAYWANFWYQGEKSRRELLIESLMGRTNREIREIKDGFADKKYSDSLVKCMKTELKEDKFKKAVLLVLEERKMEEKPGYPIDRHLVEDDVHDLYKAVKSEKGGETAMINIIVVRSDAHLREVLRQYEHTYRANFAREMLKKSGNLVGEMLAHILNGVINKPVRDALLVHHALSLSKSDSIRTELLISRLVRYHWDRPHMEAVKREYRTRYGTDMQKAVKEGTRGEWGEFCTALCLRRMGDEVREVSRTRTSEREREIRIGDYRVVEESRRSH